TKPQILTGGQTGTASPTFSADRLYQVELTAQTEGKFLETPGGRRGGGGAFAGVLRRNVETARVSPIFPDQPAWGGGVGNRTLVTAKDFQGRPGCDAPHKIVEFLLPAGSLITLQFSGSTVRVLKVTVTRSPGGMS